MGYTTDFENSFEFDKPMKPEHANYIRAFCNTRRMKRYPEAAELLPDPVRIAAGLPIGKDGGYFVGAGGFKGQERDHTVVDYNTPPGQLCHIAYSDFKTIWDKNEELAKSGDAQPGLWCQWTVSEDNTKLEWDGGEKFYEYVPWLKYLISNFIEPWGYVLNGYVEYQGEDYGDKGTIRVRKNLVEVER